MIDCKETPVQFGPDGSLIGIVTTPADGSLAPVACLLLNMGANSRIGPRRINVKLARQLVGLGIGSIRLDLSGQGDSGPPSGSKHFRTQAVQDMQAAMNLVETLLGVRRFIVIGLCSGAANGLALAVADARVIGLVMLDGYAFPGRRARWERTIRRAMAAPTNPAFIGKTTRWLQRKFSRNSALATSPDIFEPEAEAAMAATFRRSMTQIAERGVAALFVYSGTMHVTDRNRDQLGPFAHEPFMRHAEYRFIGEIDHVLTSIASQRMFMGLVSDWVADVTYGGSTTSAQAAASSRAATQPSALRTRLEPRVDTVF